MKTQMLMKKMRTLIALIIMFQSAAVFAQNCDRAAKARAAAMLELQKSDQFIPNDGEPPKIFSVTNNNILGPSQPDKYYISVTFGSKDQNQGVSRRLDYLVTISPESCSVQNIFLAMSIR